MTLNTPTYIVGTTPVHTGDARIKIALLLAFSVGIFFVNSWPVMLVCALVVLLLACGARIPARMMLVPLMPVVVLAAFALLCAVITDPTLQGFFQGLLVAVRMVVLVAASFIVCFTTNATHLLGAFAWFISPLRALRVPVDDIAMVLSLAVRFIPLVTGEFHAIRCAQRARGATLRSVSFWRKLQLLGAAFAALFIGLFRHADAMAVAMDARCYGAGKVRTRLR